MTLEEVLKNKDAIIASKKASFKKTDAVVFAYDLPIYKTEQVKAVSGDMMEVGKLGLKLVINTTNLIDSHMDCHIPGLWDKSLLETKQLFLLQEHEWEFENVIADSINNEFKAYVQKMQWSKLGASFQGSTQALMFDVTIDERNEYMFSQYRKGYVNNHSVGMRYVKYFLCCNSDNPSYSQEKANWDKYYPMVANKEVADSAGYFFAVTEAQLIEGSAVVKGSNFVTPVFQVTEKQDKEYCDECGEDTDSMEADNGAVVCKGCGTRRKDEPSNDTHKQEPTNVTPSKSFVNFY